MLRTTCVILMLMIFNTSFAAESEFRLIHCSPKKNSKVVSSNINYFAAPYGSTTSFSHSTYNLTAGGWEQGSSSDITVYYNVSTSHGNGVMQEEPFLLWFVKDRPEQGQAPSPFAGFDSIRIDSHEINGECKLNDKGEKICQIGYLCPLGPSELWRYDYDPNKYCGQMGCIYVASH